MKGISVIGNRHIIEPFRSAVREGRLASAYLLEGPFGSGKRTLARYLSALIACSSPTEQGPCFACRDCENVLALSHPDVFLLTPEKDKEYISVESARRANEAALTAPIHAPKRVFLIENAAKLHPAAQNALLKNLEEPRSQSIYLLLCEEAGSVLATIRSRAVIYRMQLFEDSQIFSYLTERFPKESPENLHLAARLSGGALGQAEAFLQDRRMADCRKKTEEYCRVLMRGGSFAEFCALIPPDTKKEFLPLFYRVLFSAVRDLLCADVSSQRQFFCADAPLVCAASQKTLLALSEKLCELLDPAMANANAAASLLALHACACGQ